MDYNFITLSNLKKQIQSLHKSNRGQILILVSLLLIPIILILGLAIDSSVGLANKRKLQMAVDAAAKAGATNGNGQIATITSESQKVFAVNTANMTGITGPSVSMNSSSGAVTVSASVVVSNAFMKSGGTPTSTYTASASALPRTSSFGCIYSLDSSASGAINLSGGSQMKVTGCGIYANSSSASAVQLSGSANITANFLKVVGNYTTSGGATVTTTQGITTSSTPISNPIGTITIPSYSSCNYNNYSSPSYGTQTINPGVYCNGINVSGSATVTMNPGQYIIDGGSLTVGGSGTLSGSNVTIILTKNLTSSYPTVNVSGAASLNISAPTGNSSNSFNGIAIYQNPNAPGSGVNSIWGSGNLNITGIVAFPNQTLTFTGAGSDNAPCTILIAKDLTFQGSGNINCTSSLISAYMAGR
jgi:Flp pilus assembly protein TadG